MPPSQTVQNHFIAGLKTEFTGLNFPENAATDTANCVYTLIGDVQRRGGINYEANDIGVRINAGNVARSSFRWLNAGGDGTSQILVQQIGFTLYFWKSSSATVANPLSTTLLPSNVNINVFLATGSTADASQSECQYAMGNGYLFVFHPNCDPFYCIFSNNTVTANVITLQIRDFIGIPEPGVADNFRPNTLSDEHKYNLINQGWNSGSGWTGTGTFIGATGNTNFSISTQTFEFPGPGDIITMPLLNQANLTVVTNGSLLQFKAPGALIGANNNLTNLTATFTGIVSNYVHGGTINDPSTITFQVATVDYAPNFHGHQPSAALGTWSGGNFFALPATQISISLINRGFIDTWKTALGNYPSNADVWWLYKDTSNVFSPATTFSNVQPSTSPAPKGTFILNAFNQRRSIISSIPGLTDISTVSRPGTGAFYAGRVWYAGVNAFISASGDEPNTTFTENIYLSQVVVSPTNFGRCYQNNDPTSQDLFSILPTDGGVITIPGCGAIYKLFALRFGLLVFAANGIWFISGSSGIGFTAEDFTVTKISSIQTVSGTSFIEVQGYPFFWNQEGIYEVVPSQQEGSARSPDIQLAVNNLCLGSILAYYANIPLVSKAYSRGDYHQLDYVVQWCFRSTNENGINNRYNYDTILNFNVVTKAFYPYTLPSNSLSVITDIKYIQNPGGSGAPGPVLKYLTAVGPNYTFSEENDFTDFIDFFNENQIGYNYNSFFVTGYNLAGQALRKFQIPYVYMFSRNPVGSECTLQAIWDYAGGSAEGKQSTKQLITMGPNSLYRKVRLRGRGMAVQLRVSSMQGQPFDLMGWSVLDQVNMAV